jgi:hypothetical protein
MQNEDCYPNFWIYAGKFQNHAQPGKNVQIQCGGDLLFPTHSIRVQGCQLLPTGKGNDSKICKQHEGLPEVRTPIFT